MHRPRIGIPLTLDDRGRWRSGREYHYIDRSYADAIDRAGGAPVHLPIQQGVRALIDGVDGLLLPGGDDFPPETPLPAGIELDLAPAEQLAFDESLYDAAQLRGLPILGICYGMQLMARREGGRLHAHLPSERPDAIDHKLPAEGRHNIVIRPGSLLADAIGATGCEVNSLHHQAVRSLAPQHRAVAFGPDDIIEALEDDRKDVAGGGAKRWQIGVQWHPEKLPGASSERLFAAFVEACREGAAKRSRPKTKSPQKLDRHTAANSESRPKQGPGRKKGESA